MHKLQGNSSEKSCFSQENVTNEDLFNSSEDFYQFFVDFPV